MKTQAFGILSSFDIIRPPIERDQAQLLDWLAEAHAQADAVAQGQDRRDPAKVETYKRLFHRIGCGPDRIARRGSELSDALKTEFSEMDIYRIVPGGSPRGSGILERTQFFARVARQRLETFYPDSTSRPDHLVHVSCTGYISPSAAQSLVNTRGWSGKTAVTHAYHMGCYASIPAVRIAAGHLALSRKPTERVDIVHTELCSLHLDSQEHSPEQAVVQSLFGDGHVRYSLTPSDGPRPHKGFELFGIHEYIVPGTESSMSWQTADWGMKMTLSRDVPRLVGGSIEGFIRDLLEPSGLSLEEAADAAVFAVHPGGPKIIDFVQDKLKLQDAQVRQSRDVLRKYGNMSSATLPHVWKEILEDESVPAGKPIISLAFGPGLTVFGLLMRKV